MKKNGVMKRNIVILITVIVSVIILGTLSIHYVPVWVSISVGFVAVISFIGGWLAKKYWTMSKSE